MSAPLIASMPQFTQLGVNARIDVEALDPTTGLPVDGVVVTVVDIFADVTEPPPDITGTPGPGSTIGPFMLVPGPQPL
jgi:hypothetical protein